MAIDTHCHLFDEAFKDDYKEVIEAAKENGISKLVLVGFSLKNNIEAYNMSLNYDFIYPTCGIHPEECNQTKPSDLLELEEFIKSHKVYAIGECGLDYYWIKDNKEAQKDLFTKQIELALKYNLPLIIHSRDSIGDVYDIVMKYPNLKFVLHSYSSSVEMLKRFLKMDGCYISLGGPVTFKNAKDPKEVASFVPLDRLMIETDCPYLSPVPYRGKRNEPSYVRYTLEEIARLKGMDSKALEEILDKNSTQFFNIK